MSTLHACCGCSYIWSTCCDCSNEEEIGAALKKSDIAREDIYITSKLWNDSHGREETIKAFHQSMKKQVLTQVHV